MLEKRGEELTGVISIVIDDATVRERIRHRAGIEDRKDDMDDEIISTRIANYHKKTEPLIAYYEERGKYNRINGNGPVGIIFGRICRLLEKSLG